MRKRLTHAERLRNHLDRLSMTPEAAALELGVKPGFLTAILIGGRRGTRMLWLALKQLYRDEIRRANKTCDHIMGWEKPKGSEKKRSRKSISASALFPAIAPTHTTREA